MERAINTFMDTSCCYSIKPLIERKWYIIVSRDVIEQIRKRVEPTREVRLQSVLGKVHDVQIAHLIVVCPTVPQTHPHTDTPT